jgi:site-specific DNA-cytosine methylase
MSEIAVADLFCGPGGMSIGFDEFFDVTLAVDHMADPCNTYRKNLTGVVRQRDVRNISAVGGDFQGVSAVIGGPPCRPFSKLNTRKDPNDPRITLWEDFMRIVEESKVDFFLMENVPTIFAYIKKAILRKARDLGYHTTYGVLEASDYGVPQARKRWIVIGTRKPFAFPEPVAHRLTVRDAFARIGSNDGFFNTREKTLAKFAHVPVGHWVPISSGRFRNAIRLSWDEPAPTIVNASKVYMIHPDGHRVITETEAAVLQDFPYDYQIEGNRRSRCQQIADAAPPSLMRAIAEQIYRTQYKELN